jgi:hypothetical protein
VAEGLAVKRALALAVALTGCASEPSPKPAEKAEPHLDRWGKPVSVQPPPSWVAQLPGSTATRVYAVGRSGPTFWPQDALANASEDARGKLALALASHVERVEQASEASGGAGFAGEGPTRNAEASNGRNARLFDLTKEATDLVLSNARIEATWIDEAGVRDERGTAWALAAIDVGEGKNTFLPAAAKSSSIPAWLEALPSATGRIHASGYSGPTFRPENAVAYARDAAIKNLAATLRSHVQAYQLLVETSSRLSVDEYSHTDHPERDFEDLVRRTARIEEVWVDVNGVRAGEPAGSVWALASIDVGTTKGSYRTIDNADLGPALDDHGNAAPAREPESTPSKSKR